MQPDDRYVRALQVVPPRSWARLVAENVRELGARGTAIGWNVRRAHTRRTMSKPNQREHWRSRLLLSRIGEVLVALADSFLGNFRR